MGWVNRQRPRNRSQVNDCAFWQGWERKAEKIAPEFTVCVLAVVAMLPLEGSGEVENPNDLDQDHDCHADSDEDFHVVSLGSLC